MLKQRVITALILAPLITWSILTFSHRAFAIEMGMILMIAAWEWARLAGINSQPGRFVYAFVIGGLLLALAFFMHSNANGLKPVLYVTSAWWVVAAILIIIANREKITVTKKISVMAMFASLLVGALILSGAFASIVAIHRFETDGAIYILTLFLLIWAADIAAYFSGKAFGRHKLAINVSPGKTWEGVAGGLLAAALVAYIIGIYLKLGSGLIPYFIVVAVITVSFSIVGDLFESLFKRRVGVKDSSQLLPGHGGVFDRLDSLISAAPLFLLGLLVVGIK